MQVGDPHLPSQAESWGCAADQIEEIRLTDRTSVYVAALRESIGAPQTDVSVVKSAPETFDAMGYDPRHILPFLSDLFVSERRDTVVGWTGLRRETLSLFANFWRSSGFSQPIAVDGANGLGRAAGLSGVSAATTDGMMTRADAFVVDFGAPAGQPETATSRLTGPQRAQLRAVFLDIIRSEWKRQSDGKPPRRVICINAINTEDEAFVQAFISAGLTPISTRLRHGFAKPATWKHRLGEMRGGEFLVSVARMIKRRVMAIRDVALRCLLAPEAHPDQRHVVRLRLAGHRAPGIDDHQLFRRPGQFEQLAAAVFWPWRRDHRDVAGKRVLQVVGEDDAI